MMKSNEMTHSMQLAHSPPNESFLMHQFLNGLTPRIAFATNLHLACTYQIEDNFTRLFLA
jgi:hypothetical protein